MPFRRTGVAPFDADPSDVETGGVEFVETRRRGRYLQVLSLPDAGDRRDRDEGVGPRRGEAHEVVLREPVEVVATDGIPRPTSAVVSRYGPFEREAALQRVVELARSTGVPVYHEVDTLRPDRWTETADWVTCPGCGGGRISLVADLDGGGLCLVCQSCDARAGREDPNRLVHEWLHCPSCGSGDVNVELSATHGGDWWSCDDCLYDTRPAPPDWGYSAVRE